MKDVRKAAPLDAHHERADPRTSRGSTHPARAFIARALLYRHGFGRGTARRPRTIRGDVTDAALRPHALATTDRAKAIEVSTVAPRCVAPRTRRPGGVRQGHHLVVRAHRQPVERRQCDRPHRLLVPGRGREGHRASGGRREGADPGVTMQGLFTRGVHRRPWGVKIELKQDADRRGFHPHPPAAARSREGAGVVSEAVRRRTRRAEGPHRRPHVRRPVADRAEGRRRIKERRPRAIVLGWRVRDLEAARSAARA